MCPVVTAWQGNDFGITFFFACFEENGFENVVWKMSELCLGFNVLNPVFTVVALVQGYKFKFKYLIGVAMQGLQV